MQDRETQGFSLEVSGMPVAFIGSDQDVRGAWQETEARYVELESHPEGSQATRGVLLPAWELPGRTVSSGPRTGWVPAPAGVSRRGCTALRSRIRL